LKRILPATPGAARWHWSPDAAEAVPDSTRVRHRHLAFIPVRPPNAPPLWAFLAHPFLHFPAFADYRMLGEFPANAPSAIPPCMEVRNEGLEEVCHVDSSSCGNHHRNLAESATRSRTTNRTGRRRRLFPVPRCNRTSGIQRRNRSVQRSRGSAERVGKWRAGAGI
jgi:hypothetical protein